MLKGRDLGILAVGRAVGIARDVVSLLEELGVGAELINARFIKPLDEELISNVGRKFNRLVTIEDNSVVSGFGTAVLELLSDHGINRDLMRIGIPDEFVEQGRIDILFELLNMEPESIVESIFSRWPDIGSRQTLELRKIGQS